MEVVNLRFQAIEGRIDAEVAAVQEHFAELRLCMTKGTAGLELGGRIDRLDDRMDQVEVAFDIRFDHVDARLDSLEERVERVECRLGRYFERTLAMLHDIQRRLPPPR